MLGRELRNPLGAVSKSTHIIRQIAVEGRVSQRALDAADRKMQSMTEFVSQLHNVARISERLMLDTPMSRGRARSGPSGSFLAYRPSPAELGAT